MISFFRMTLLFRTTFLWNLSFMWTNTSFFISFFAFGSKKPSKKLTFCFFAFCLFLSDKGLNEVSSSQIGLFHPQERSFCIVKHYPMRPRADLSGLPANANFMNPFEIVHEVDNRGSLGNSSASSWSLKWPQLFSVLLWKLYWKFLLSFSNNFFLITSIL